MSITKNYVFYNVPQDVIFSLKNWFPDLFASELNTVTTFNCVHFFSSDRSSFNKNLDAVLISCENNHQYKFVFCFDEKVHTVNFPKIFCTDFLNYNSLLNCVVPKPNFCYLPKKYNDLFSNFVNKNSCHNIQTCCKYPQKTYKFSLCFNIDDVWSAVESQNIPVLLDSCYNEENFIFNKSRILFYNKDTASIMELYNQNCCLYNFLFEQSVFNTEAINYFNKKKEELRDMLSQIMISSGYFMLTNNKLPSLDHELEKKTNSCLYTMSQYNQFYSNFVYEEFLNKKFVNSYNPNENGRRILVLFASHTNTQLKMEIIQNNLKYFMFNCVDIVVVNSSGLFYSKDCRRLCESQNIKYMEVENDEFVDFGKFMFGLGQTAYKKYHTVIFTNDSFIIHSPIDFFINCAIKSTSDLYAYNDSSEGKYHYQSYFFTLKVRAIPQFINLFMQHCEKIKNVTNHNDIIKYYEINLISAFKTVDCYLKIGLLSKNLNKNIFFNNDDFYKELLLLGLLPFTKLKRYLKDTLSVPSLQPNYINKTKQKQNKGIDFFMSTDFIGSSTTLTKF